jgi:LmbE family N-acetylglucosaminyl deacetylase
MKQTIVGVFAHPDDEAFGPAGTLATLAKKHDVYLICVTRGDAGFSSIDHNGDLGDVRLVELQNSARILGVKEVFFLNYKDGTLCNNIYHQVDKDIQQHLDILKPETLITFEHRGVSGHIDHIAVSMITSFLYNKLEYVRYLWYYCIDTRHRTAFKDYFIYFPPGYEPSEYNQTIDVSTVWDTKMKAIHQHKSQQGDIDKIVPIMESLPKEEYFIAIEKP